VVNQGPKQSDDQVFGKKDSGISCLKTTPGAWSDRQSASTIMAILKDRIPQERNILSSQI